MEHLSLLQQAIPLSETQPESDTESVFNLKQRDRNAKAVMTCVLLLVHSELQEAVKGMNLRI